jgi:uncharacterized protein (TIGR03000 family)
MSRIGYSAWAAAALTVAALSAAPAVAESYYDWPYGYTATYSTPRYSYYPSYPAYYYGRPNYAYLRYYYPYDATWYYRTPAAYDLTTPAYAYRAPASAVESRSYYPSDDLVPAAPAAPAPTAVATATVAVRVPPDAEVWFGDHLTRQRGEVREYESPPLPPDRDYHYDVRARWMDGDRVVERARTVTVRANGRADIDFLRP